MDDDLIDSTVPFDQRVPDFSEGFFNNSLQQIPELFDSTQSIKTLYNHPQSIKAEALSNTPLLNQFSGVVDQEVEEYNPMESFVSDGDFTLFPNQL